MKQTISICTTWNYFKNACKGNWIFCTSSISSELWSKYLCEYIHFFITQLLQLFLSQEGSYAHLITWSKSGRCDLSILFLLSGTEIFYLLRSALMWLFCGNMIDSCPESLCSISLRCLFLNSLFSSCWWLIR